MIKAKKHKKLFLLLGVLLLSLLFSFLVGRYPQPGLIDLWKLNQDAIGWNIFYNLRVPRVILGLLLGMALGASGLVFQTVFNNPLVGSGMLGVTQGAAFGAAIGIIFFQGKSWVVQLLAIGLGSAGLVFSVFSARRIHYGGWTLRLILSGSVVSALFGAGLSLLKYLADSRNQLHAIEFWLMGGLNFTTWRGLPAVILLVTISLIILWKLRWRINLLALNSETAGSLGVSVVRERLLLLTAAVIAVSTATSLSGIVGWVGLIVPHLARKMFGADTRYSFPASVLIGGILVLVSDNGLRTIQPLDVPLGIVTSFVGVIIFIIIMGMRRR